MYKKVMSDDKSSLRVVQNAIYDLKSAHRIFTWLHQSGEGAEKLKEYKCDFKTEAKICEDLSAQGKYHLSRAEKLDEYERELKKRQEQEIAQLRLKQRQEEEQRELEIIQREQSLAEKRAEMLKKQEQTQVIEIEKRAAATKKRSKKEKSDVVSSPSGSDETQDENEPSEANAEKKKSKSKSNTVFLYSLCSLNCCLLIVCCRNR